MANSVQISAHVSVETKKRLDATSRASGVAKGRLVEDALVHHLTAIEQLPQGFIIPGRVVLKGDTFTALVEDLEADTEPTRALSDLFHDD